MPNTPTPIAHQVIADLERQGTPEAIALIPQVKARMQIGIETYGAPLTADTDIDPLTYSLEEAIDLCKYIRVLIAQRQNAALSVAIPRTLYSQALEMAIALKRMET